MSHVKVAIASADRTKGLLAQRERERDPALVAKAHAYYDALDTALVPTPKGFELVDPAAQNRARSIREELRAAGWDFELESQS